MHWELHTIIILHPSDISTHCHTTSTGHCTPLSFCIQWAFQPILVLHPPGITHHYHSASIGHSNPLSYYIHRALHSIIILHSPGIYTPLSHYIHRIVHTIIALRPAGIAVIAPRICFTSQASRQPPAELHSAAVIACGQTTNVIVAMLPLTVSGLDRSCVSSLCTV